MKLQVGDRVAVYDGGKRSTATILQFDESSAIEDTFVETDIGIQAWFSSKQCRKLKSKAAKKNLYISELSLKKMGKYQYGECMIYSGDEVPDQKTTEGRWIKLKRVKS